MSTIWFVWLLVPAPSLPLALIFAAFRRVLQSKKFEMRMLLQRGQALTKYLSAYGGTKKTIIDSSVPQMSSEALVESIVDQIFRLRYSISEYIAALAFNFLVNSAFLILAFSYAGIELGIPASIMPYLHGNPYLKDIIAGSLGALIWGIYELCNRYRDGDLPPDAIFSSGARLLFAGAAGAIAGEVINDRLAWVVAFGLGVLPTSAVHQFIVERTRKALNLPDVSPVKADPSLAILQGWNADISEKFERAGVTSLQQLACSNQFQLFLRSNMEWRVILDLSDQALLALYIGDGIQKLRPLGIRSAVELADLDWFRDDKEYFAGFTYDEAIKRIADALESDVQTVRLLVRSISEDATVSFLGGLWSDDMPDDGEDEDEEKQSSETDPNSSSANLGNPTLVNPCGSPTANSNEGSAK